LFHWWFIHFTNRQSNIQMSLENYIGNSRFKDKKKSENDIFILRTKFDTDQLLVF